MRYLDPRNDLTFKKVFGEHPDLLISFLNALMPFKDESEYIEKIEYLPRDLVQETPFSLDSMLKVRCTNAKKQQFIVEIQMYWVNDFIVNVEFGATKAFVKKKGIKRLDEHIPIYTLSLLDDDFICAGNDKDSCCRHYSDVVMYDTKDIIPNMHFILIDLHKFQLNKSLKNRMAVLWLRYLTEIKDMVRDCEIANDLKEDVYIGKALNLLDESTYSDAEQYAYERCWDSVSSCKTLFGDGTRKVMKERFEYYSAKEEGVCEERLKVAKRMKAANIDIDTICSVTGLTREEIEKI